jgi:two-component system KDP operon response regulator KdpE
VHSVLIVDDNEDLISVLREVLLTLPGIAVHQAMSGVEALQIYSSIDPALMILDEGLPDMHGSELLRALREAYPRARRPALFLTGSPSSPPCQPDDMILMKPVEIEPLLAAVRLLVRAQADPRTEG